MHENTILEISIIEFARCDHQHCCHCQVVIIIIIVVIAIVIVYPLRYNEMIPSSHIVIIINTAAITSLTTSHIHFKSQQPV